MSIRILVVAISSTMLFASAASAGDWTRPGWYLGAGGGGGFNFFNKFIKEEFPGSGVTIDSAGSANVRGGYRVWPWLALEAMYEGTYDSQINLNGDNLAKLSTHSFLANLKLFLPIKRFQPYIAVGPGAQYGDFRGDGPLNIFDTTRWDFTLRTALGLDFYITEHWVIDGEIAPSIRFTDYSNIPSKSTDNVTMTVSIGVQYRF
ncbi:MAG: porin family protein [Deltaproteobacteria bacterium]|nr:porin family protein [Deltaproteobacteria bacterium]MBW2417221.1 porin family protein [Deltaproteobacteria bacterium]